MRRLFNTQMPIGRDQLLIGNLRLDIGFWYKVMRNLKRVRTNVFAQSSAESEYQAMVVATCKLIGLSSWSRN